MTHVDKVRQARRNAIMFAKGYLDDNDVEDFIHSFLRVDRTNREYLQQDQNAEVQSHQRTTCDVLLLFCFKLFHFYACAELW